MLKAADLKQQLSTQGKLVAAIERRVERALAAIQTRLSQLDQPFHDRPDWQDSLELMASELHQLGDLLSRLYFGQGGFGSNSLTTIH